MAHARHMYTCLPNPDVAASSHLPNAHAVVLTFDEQTSQHHYTLHRALTDSAALSQALPDMGLSAHQHWEI